MLRFYSFVSKLRWLRPVFLGLHCKLVEYEWSSQKAGRRNKLIGHQLLQRHVLLENCLEKFKHLGCEVILGRMLLAKSCLLVLLLISYEPVRFAKPPEDTSRFAFDQFLLYSAPVGYLRRHLEMSCTFSFSLARLLLIHGTRDSQDIIFNRPRERIIFGETEWIDKRIGDAAVSIGPIQY